jgi:hypothetical protein
MGVVVVRMARMAAGLRLRGGHGERGNMSCAVSSKGPIESRTRQG